MIHGSTLQYAIEVCEQRIREIRERPGSSIDPVASVALWKQDKEEIQAVEIVKRRQETSRDV